MRLKTRAVLVVAFLFAATMAGQAQGVSLHRYTHIDDTHWLLGCIPDERVDQFLRAGFGFEGPAAIILCAGGYTGIAKRIGH